MEERSVGQWTFFSLIRPFLSSLPAVLGTIRVWVCAHVAPSSLAGSSACLLESHLKSQGLCQGPGKEPLDDHHGVTLPYSLCDPKDELR